MWYIPLALIIIWVLARIWLAFEEKPVTADVADNFPQLVEQVRKVDPEAADWLEKGDKSSLQFFERADRLPECFIWEQSPQGHAYWVNIYKQVGGM